ncbi:hypothetical protein E8E13_000771 [Curvularia kusanoi]|uniref:Uncharacterized protein n=1 Tax=Curvularia kusanoi TaxID=90978 RepID=A0A9P4T8N7_CURKU|nr:hypothetical protein E8E13_000771 [Curvularia kusanoi]
MKSARTRRTWSTRPKSPKEERHVNSNSKPVEEPPSNYTVVPHDATAITDSWASRSFRKDSIWEDPALASPVSSRDGSFLSNFSDNHTCGSPASSHTSPFSEYSHTENAYIPPLAQHTASTFHDGFDIGFTKSLDCLPVYLDTHGQRLLHQFVESAASRLVPVDIYRAASITATGWISDCIKNPNGAPYIFAALTASARAVGLKPEIYKWQAISEVNKLLSNPTTSTGDMTIAAVLILLALEEADLANPCLQGSERKWSLSANSAHLNGLRAMIEQRGGLAGLSNNRCLQTFILMHSIAQCITTFKRPYALLADFAGNIEDYASLSQSSMNQSMIADTLQRLCADPALVNVLRSVDVFISDLAIWYNAGRTPYRLDPFDLQKHSCLLMYRLFNWYKEGEDSEIAGGLGREPADQAICLAHLACLVIATEPHADSFGSRLSNVIVKLRQALQRTPVSHWASEPDVLLWIITMGALGAKGLPRSQPDSISEFEFFSQYAQLAFPPIQNGCLTSAHSLSQSVQRLPWITSIFDTRARRLWGQMGLCIPEIIDMYESSSEEEGAPIDEEHVLGQSTTARFFPAEKSASKKSSPS